VHLLAKRGGKRPIGQLAEAAGPAAARRSAA
jgi:hypothetical protein